MSSQMDDSVPARVEPCAREWKGRARAGAQAQYLFLPRHHLVQLRGLNVDVIEPAHLHLRTLPA